MTNTCFVIMPIGTQTVNTLTVKADDLRKNYDFIIKNAILQADSTLEVIRADEELNPGSISNDIFTKLMHSKYVIADVTYPNPNVFYELGIRHAISSRTILIKERITERVPFDISHLRYIEYTKDPGGMEELSKQLKARFSFYESHPGKPDNQFLELCEFTDFIPETFKQRKSARPRGADQFTSFVLKHPDLLAAILTGTDKDKNQALANALKADTDGFAEVLKSALLEDT